MDIQPTLTSEPGQLQKDVEKIFKEVEKEPFNQKKALTFASRVQNQDMLCEQLVERALKTIDLKAKINIYTLIAEIMFLKKESYHQVEQCFLWIIGSIYKIRWQIDLIEEESEFKLKFLSNTLKLVNELVAKSIKIESNTMEEALMVDRLFQQICSLEHKKCFQSLSNIMFSLALLPQIEPSDEKSTQIQITLIRYYFASLNNVSWGGIEVQNMVVNTLIKVLQKYSQLVDSFTTVIENSTFYVQLLSMHLFRLDPKFITKFECSCDQQFELITLILQKYYENGTNDTKHQLCLFWMNNCCNLIRNSGFIDLTCYLKELSSTILMELLSLTNLSLQSHGKSSNRIIITIIWKGILEEKIVMDALPAHQALFRGTELILYRFVREVLNILPCSLDSDEMLLVLQVYSQYYELILKQSECTDIRTRCVHLFISNYLDLLKPAMLFNNDVSIIDENHLDLHLFNQNLLGLIFQIHYRSFKDFGSILGKVQKNMGVVLIKYLISNNIDLKQIFSNDEIVEYLIQNNIELHSDKIDYAIHQKISINIEKYIKMIRKSTQKNIYEKHVLMFMADLLENEPIQSQKVKLLPSSFNIAIYIVQNINLLFEIVQERGGNVKDYVSSLYSYASRSLYLHFPDGIYLLLLSIAELKAGRVEMFLEQEIVFVQNIGKFCNHYSSQHSYSLMGYASILLVIYGPIATERNLTILRKVQIVLESKDFFLQKLIELLSMEGVMSQKWFGFSRKKQNIGGHLFDQFQTIMRRNFMYGLMKNLQFAAHNHYERYGPKLYALRMLIQTIFQEKYSIQKPISQLDEDSNRKRKISFSEDDEEIKKEQNLHKNHLNDHKKQNCNPHRNTFLQTLNEKYKNTDEFKSIRDIDTFLMHVFHANSQINDNCDIFKRSNLKRVHGKVRSIVQVKKQ